MLNTPFSPWPSYSEEEADVVKSVLLSNKVNYWTGAECRAFATEFAKFAGAERAIATANGTISLELALKGLGIGAGDEVIVSPRSYVASAAAIVNVGARPIFTDVDRDTQNITAETIEAVLSTRTRAVICVHLAGWPCDMALADSERLFVIEDCAQAHGASYRGRSVGSIGHVGCWSFCQDKIMTTGGEGGMVTTNSDELWSRMWSMNDQGKSWDAMHQPNSTPGFRWVHERFGSNGRLTEMQAAIGRIQIRRMPEWSALRRGHCETIWAAARSCAGLRAPMPPDDSVHAGYKCYVFVEQQHLKAGWNRDRILAEINARDVPCYSGLCPEIYLEKSFQEASLAPNERLPVAKELGETSLMFLVHPTLKPHEIEKSCEVLIDVLRQGTVNILQTRNSGRFAEKRTVPFA